MSKPKNWVFFNCDVCGKECYTSKNKYNKYKTHTCSLECRNKAIWTNYLPWKKFWKLTVIERWECKWTMGRELICQCDCWNMTTINVSNRGKIKSCWCLWGKETHWMSETAEYKTWRALCDRCNNKSHYAYKDYGWRWITVWYKNFEEFFEDVWKRPWQGYSIDRIDNNRGYEVWNCRRTTIKTQCNNRRNNVKCIINWEELTLQQWADKLQMNRKTLKRHILKWKIEWELYNYKLDKWG